MRQKLVFGGNKLRDPQFTWFYSALSKGILHGHPGDEALVVTREEAAELSEAMYAGLPHDTRRWTTEHSDQFSAFAGKKLILSSDSKGYVTREQARMVECEVDPRDFMGLPPQVTEREEEDANNE